MTALRLTVLAALLSVSGALALPADAQQRDTLVKGFALSNDKPIQIESDNPEIREQEKKAFFNGNVRVVQGPTTLRSSRMIVYYKGEGGSISEGQSDIDRIEVFGNVSLASGTQSAKGENGSFDMRTELLVLEGKQVVLADGPNVFTGCKLTVQMGTGQAKLDSCGSRVKILVVPKSSKTN